MISDPWPTDMIKRGNGILRVMEEKTTLMLTSCADDCDDSGYSMVMVMMMMI